MGLQTSPALTGVEHSGKERTTVPCLLFTDLAIVCPRDPVFVIWSTQCILVKVPQRIIQLALGYPKTRCSAISTMHTVMTSWM
jgi:hypothetical protein